MWTDHDPSGGWPFGKTLPYHTVHATQDVLDGAPIVKVARDQSGAWFFSSITELPWTETTMRHIVTVHPGVASVADLASGQHADMAEGSWQRPQEK